MLPPKDPSHPAFAGPDTDFRAHMIAYIRSHFSDLLGDAARLLDQPDGLDRLQRVLAARREEASSADTLRMAA